MVEDRPVEVVMQSGAERANQRATGAVGASEGVVLVGFLAGVWSDGGGKYSGPRWPHAASASEQSIKATMALPREGRAARPRMHFNPNIDAL